MRFIQNTSRLDPCDKTDAQYDSTKWCDTADIECDTLIRSTAIMVQFGRR